MGGVFSRKSSSNDQLKKCNEEKAAFRRNCVLLRSCNQTKRFVLPMEMLAKQFFGRKGTLVNYLGVPRNVFIKTPKDAKLPERICCMQKFNFGSLYQMYKQGKCSLRKDTSPWFSRKSIYSHAKPMNSIVRNLVSPYLAANTRCAQATSSQFKMLFGSIIKTSKLYPIAFYKKFAPTLLRGSPNAMFSFVLYEQTRARLVGRAKACNEKL